MRSCDWERSSILFPHDETPLLEMVAHNRALGESCLCLTGPLLGHIDSSVARDLEAVRVALVKGKLKYLSLSYGGQLGAAYAELYPENIWMGTSIILSLKPLTWSPRLPLVMGKAHPGGKQGACYLQSRYIDATKVPDRTPRSASPSSKNHMLLAFVYH